MGIKKFKIDFTEVNNYNLDDAILIDSDNENDTRFGYLRKYLALSGNVSIPIISKYGSATNNTVIPNGVFAQFQLTSSSNFNPISYSGLISFYINKTTQNVPNASALYLFVSFSDGAGTTWNLPIYRTENEWATLADVWQKQVLLLWTFPGKFFLVGCEKNTTLTNAISAESIDLNNTQYVISTSIGDNIQLNGEGTASNNIIVFPYNLAADKSIIWFIQQGSTDITFRKYTSSTVYTDTIYSENDNIDTFFDTSEGWTFTKLDAVNMQPILTNFTDGNFKIVASIEERNDIPILKRQIGCMVAIGNSIKQFQGSTVENVDWENDSNWSLSIFDDTWSTGSTASEFEFKNSYGDVMFKMNKFGQVTMNPWLRAGGNASASLTLKNYLNNIFIDFNTSQGRGYFNVNNANGDIVCTISSFEKSKLLGLDVQNEKIINVATPTEDTDAATKKYVDDNIGGNITVDEDNVTMSARTILSGTNLGANADILESILGGGTAGQVLKSIGDGTTPTWQNESGGGSDSRKSRVAYNTIMNSNY